MLECQVGMSLCKRLCVDRKCLQCAGSQFPLLISALLKHPVLLCAEALNSDVGQQAIASRFSSRTSGCSVGILPVTPHPPPVSPASDSSLLLYWFCLYDTSKGKRGHAWKRALMRGWLRCSDLPSSMIKIRVSEGTLTANSGIIKNKPFCCI